MDLERQPPLATYVIEANCCGCGCIHCSTKDHPSSSSTWLRSVKRKVDELEGSYTLVIPYLNFPHVAKVEIANECVALREMVSNQQKTIDDLLVELDEERNASSSATNEAMSMIFRLQKEKAEIQMEARQFKLFVEEKMTHDQDELFAMEDLLYKREETIQSLTCEIQAYKYRMMSYGISEAEAKGVVMNLDNNRMEPPLSVATQTTTTNDNNFIGLEPSMTRNNRGDVNFSRSNSVIENVDELYEFPMHEYPQLKCNINKTPQAYTDEPDTETIDVERYAYGETPQSHDHITDLEYRINQLENFPRENESDVGTVFGTTKNVLEKVIVGHSPRQQRPKDFCGVSTDSTSSFCARDKEMHLSDESPNIVGHSHTPKKIDNNNNMEDASEVGDDMSDRIYMIDSVHAGVGVESDPDFMSIPREKLLVQEDIRDPKIKNLYMRLEALEADKETMRQTLISMQTDKTQLVLLKEIAQHLCKEMSPARNLPVKKQDTMVFSIFSVFKWILSIFFWRKSTRRSKYMFGRTANNVGLLMLLDKGPRIGNWRCLSSTQV